MKIRKRHIVAYCIAAAAIVVAGYSILRQQKLRKELTTIIAEKQQFSKDSLLKRSLFQIDSLLMQGQYSTALDAYEQQFLNVQNDGKEEVSFRIKVAKQFVDFYSTPNQSNSVKDSIRSLDTNRVAADASVNVRTLDSLQFALEKTKVQLERLQKQLKKKSYSEYLTFRNPKKHLLHYVGQVQNNKANGYGIAVFDTGSRYEGDWVNNLREGEGAFYWPDGEYYIGSYENDLRNGLGTYYWPNGEKYVGEWKDDQRSGEGTFYAKDGKILTSGIWKKDKLVEEFKNKKD
ncbi:MORN repeat-containing protein [Aquimarina brevivitae]|uniref:MORN repeat protein n=1 Tax=Aquimarina brevivitae TaxID=323412 RepID=A0A4Q7P0T6_9FLAO|nr:hypothetical protein [Aquimarina brevivitae]RZS92262.1 MORN repeat protein [Aquimarina brevivitae]